VPCFQASESIPVVSKGPKGLSSRPNRHGRGFCESVPWRTRRTTREPTKNRPIYHARTNPGTSFATRTPPSKLLISFADYATIRRHEEKGSLRHRFSGIGTRTVVKRIRGPSHIGLHTRSVKHKLLNEKQAFVPSVSLFFFVLSPLT
jgi:hypothetical protein